MRDEQQPELSELLGEAMGFYGKDVSRFALDAWWQSLRRFELRDVQHALSIHIQDADRGQWAPKPADIIRLLDGGAGDRSLQAWTAVDRAVREIGPYQTVVFDDHRIHAVIDEMGGWIALCDTQDEKEWEFKGHEFRKRYQGYVLRQPVAWPAMLTGRVEAKNRRLGAMDKIPAPQLIGDPRRAQLVIDRARERGRLACPLADAVARIGREGAA